MVNCTFLTATPKGHHLVYCGPSSPNLTNLCSNFQEPLAPTKTLCRVGVFSGLSSKELAIFYEKDPTSHATTHTNV